MKIKKGDIVQIISGKDRGRSGKTLKVFPKNEKILVEGIAMKKRHRRPRKAREKGQVVNLPSPIHVSNVMLRCKNCGRSSRTGFGLRSNGSKVRICKRCKGEV